MQETYGLFHSILLACVSDVLRLKWSDFQNDRLYYAMGKNLKAGSLKVPDKVLEILKQKPKSNAHDLVFSDLAKMPDLSKAYEVQITSRRGTEVVMIISKTLQKNSD